MQYFSDEYLEHHGIKGQKWGVRRFQNPDGTLTKAGKKRVAKLNAKVDKTYNKNIASLSKKKDKIFEKRGVEFDKAYGSSNPKRWMKSAKLAGQDRIAGKRLAAKIDYEQKVRDIRKSEINAGFNYMERARTRDILVTGLVSQYGGVALGVYDTHKYSEGYHARKDAKRDYKSQMKAIKKEEKKINNKKFRKEFAATIAGNIND